MILMTLEGIGITFGDTAILQNVTQGIDEYDRHTAKRAQDLVSSAESGF